MRVFEIEAGGRCRRRCRNYDANQLIIPVQDNYGVAGAPTPSGWRSNRPIVEQMLEGGQQAIWKGVQVRSARSASGR